MADRLGLKRVFGAGCLLMAVTTAISFWLMQSYGRSEPWEVLIATSLLSANHRAPWYVVIYMVIFSLISFTAVSAMRFAPVAPRLGGAGTGRSVPVAGAE
ncbi:hypothetical protein AiwAL_09720 [Acidiphilium sp. AL]|uniref:hypothetical protein n=1 Tax=Acidiphilium sp. AL TaxID=2871704 RepID=UPI0021CAEA55|nr:hypothetical protein [Acidiphilium sp. AL]MCU4160387.1 hypothetical protein [Acidiphilium sp. AL]